VRVSNKLPAKTAIPTSDPSAWCKMEIGASLSSQLACHKELNHQHPQWQVYHILGSTRLLYKYIPSGKEALDTPWTGLR
jgi:hypothetical protein